jgi:ubiquinone/menaquinone biosynthesis C-methylase UbiE
VKNSDNSHETVVQHRYYAKTAQEYDAMHVNQVDEHFFALSIMLGALDFYGIKSILDIGSGTGRAIAQLKRARPDLLIKGIEPVEELREVAYSKGISRDDLIDGDALALQFKDGEFDLVCEFGILHHIKRPQRAVAEMLRVANRAVFISDSNNFGQGGFASRSIKQILNMLCLWPIANLIKTKGRGYIISEGDGLSYSYSVFNDYLQIKEQCNVVHLLNTVPAGINPYRTASHVALLGVKW